MSLSKEQLAKKAKEKATKEVEAKTVKEAKEKAVKEAKEAESKVKKEAKEKAVKEVEEKATNEVEEKTAKEAKEKATKEAEEKDAKKIAEEDKKKATGRKKIIKVNCYKIIMWVLLMFLLEYVSASTEPISTNSNDGLLSQMILSKEKDHKRIMKIIIQYLSIHDYFRLTQTNQAHFQTLYINMPEDILQGLHDEYSTFLTTPMVTNKAEILLWSQYWRFLQSLPANTQYQLRAQLLTFFTPKDVQPPTIQCSSMNTDIEATTKKIQTFFQDHPDTIVSKPRTLSSHFYFNGNYQNPRTTTLAMFYNPLQSTLYFWPENHHPFECRVELPSVMLFTNPNHNRIRIDRLSKLTGHFFGYDIINHYVQAIAWFNIVAGDFIGVKFTKTGSLDCIQTYKRRAEEDKIYDLIRFRRVEGEHNKYISERNDSEFTTIMTFSYPLGPYNHHPAKVDDNKAVLDTMTNLPTKNKKINPYSVSTLWNLNPKIVKIMLLAPIFFVFFVFVLFRIFQSIPSYKYKF